VTFLLEPRPREELARVIEENLAWRDERHPDLWLYPCAGSIFKKIEGIGAGRLIDQCGLKGYVHPSGRAQIFHRHANIIVNLGGAQARDIRVRLVELLASEAGHAMRTAITRELAADGRPLPAAVLRALASLARDPDPRVRRASATTLVHLLEAMSPIVRSELIVRLATSSRFELRLLIAQALRHGALGVGTMSALEHLVDDPEPEVRGAALVSARLRMAEAPSRMGIIVRRKLQHL
jgi:hypothetical protein